MYLAYPRVVCLLSARSITVCCSVLQCVALLVFFHMPGVRATPIKPDTISARSVAECVAVWCSVLQCAAVCCSVLQCAAVCCSVLCRNVLRCVAVCCSELQCVAVCCSVLHCRSLFTYLASEPLQWNPIRFQHAQLQCVAVCCSTLQRVAVCCSVL